MRYRAAGDVRVMEPILNFTVTCGNMWGLFCYTSCFYCCFTSLSRVKSFDAVREREGGMHGPPVTSASADPPHAVIMHALLRCSSTVVYKQCSTPNRQCINVLCKQLPMFEYTPS